jgi:hypothetical protein
VPVVKLQKTYKVRPIVKVLPKIKSLTRIRDMMRDLARDHDMAKVGEFDPTSAARARHLARLQIDFERQYGHAPDVRKLG